MRDDDRINGPGAVDALALCGASLLLFFVFFCGFLLLLVGFSLSLLLGFCLFLLVVVERFLLFLGGFFGLGFGC